MEYLSFFFFSKQSPTEIKLYSKTSLFCFFYFFGLEHYYLLQYSHKNDTTAHVKNNLYRTFVNSIFCIFFVVFYFGVVLSYNGRALRFLKVYINIKILFSFCCCCCFHCQKIVKAKMLLVIFKRIVNFYAKKLSYLCEM